MLGAARRDAGILGSGARQGAVQLRGRVSSGVANARERRIQRRALQEQQQKEQRENRRKELQERQQQRRTEIQLLQQQRQENLGEISELRELQKYRPLNRQERRELQERERREQNYQKNSPQRQSAARTRTTPRSKPRTQRRPTVLYDARGRPFTVTGGKTKVTPRFNYQPRQPAQRRRNPKPKISQSINRGPTQITAGFR